MFWNLQDHSQSILMEVTCIQTSDYNEIRFVTKGEKYHVSKIKECIESLEVDGINTKNFIWYELIETRGMINGGNPLHHSTLFEGDIPGIFIKENGKISKFTIPLLLQNQRESKITKLLK